MITVIIAGGSGTRLWPLSTPEYPKHLLKLVDDNSVLQATYKRAKLLGDTVYILTEASHSEIVKQQLPELGEDRFIIEPGRRGTASCIIMALDVLSRSHNVDEPIAFIHSDHQIKDSKGFVSSLESASKTALVKHEITLIGIEPTFPATGFGYIERGEAINEANNTYKVVSFKEKPNFATAEEYLKKGNFLWNCGYFVGSVRIFLDEMGRSAPDLKRIYEKLHKIFEVGGTEYLHAYLDLDSQVIDTALIEKVKDLCVVSAGFDWMDIGSFKDLHKAVESDELGNHFRGQFIYDDDVQNVYVRNEDQKPVVVIGLKDVVVVNTPEGLLVAHKNQSDRVKEAVAKIEKDKT